MSVETLLALASASFGLVVPSNLMDKAPFSKFDLSEDALLRISSVEKEEGVIFFTDINGAQLYISVDELMELADKLRTQWVKLTPTVL